MKKDFLKECISDVGNSPLDEFNTYFCVRCQNIECMRAGGNGSSFNKRVSNWEDIFFKNVPRDTNDERFDSIKAKKFVSITKETNYEIKSMEPADITKLAIPEVKIINKQEVSKPVQKNDTIELNTTDSKKLHSNTQNTEFLQGTTLDGNETVEKPGSTFVFKDE